MEEIGLIHRVTNLNGDYKAVTIPSTVINIHVSCLSIKEALHFVHRVHLCTTLRINSYCYPKEH
jgi:hypothetical protein